MPVNDELTDKELALYLRRGTIHDFQAQAADRLEQQAAEIAALRAALAAQPQPLYEGSRQGMILRAVDDTWPDRVVVYPAVAGSATPTRDGDGE